MGFTTIAAKTLDGFLSYQDVNELIDNIEYLRSESETQISLADNTAVATATGISFVAATYRAMHIEFTIERGSNYITGLILIVHDGTNVAVDMAPIAGRPNSFSHGVVFSGDISGGSVRLLFTTTSTGNAAKLNYRTKLIAVAT